MPNVFHKVKDGVKSKSATPQQAPGIGSAFALGTAALRAFEVVGLGIPAPTTAPAASQQTTRTYLNGLKYALELLMALSDDVTVFGMKVPISALLKVLNDVDNGARNATILGELTVRIERLVNIFSKTLEGKKIPNGWQDVLITLQREITSITNVISRHSSQGDLVQFLNRADNASTIAEHIRRLDQILVDLQTAISVGVGLGVNDIKDNTQGIQDNTREIRDYMMSKEQEDQFNELAKVATGSAAYDSSAREFAPQCLNGTRVSLQNQIHKWIESRTGGPALFWLSGLAGTGKSTVAHSLAEYCETQHLLGASFFFSRDQEERRVTRHLFSTLAFQLGKRYPWMKVEIAKAVKDTGIHTSNLRLQLRKLILEPMAAVKDLFSSPVVIILDALDECEETDSVSRIVDLLAIELQGQELPLKVFTTSRPERHLRLTFDSNNVQARTQSIALHNIELPVVQGDIRMYLKFKLQKIARDNLDLVNPDAWPDEADIDILVDRAAGLFSFASTMVKFIDDSGDNPQDRLATILKPKSAHVSQDKPFAQLDQLYEQIIQAMIKASPKAALLFPLTIGTIILLFNRLSCKDLARLLRIKESDVSLSLRHLHSVIIVPKDGGALQAFHPSFHDFLTDRDRCTDERFFIDHTSQHAKIASFCLERIMESLEQDICHIQDKSKLNDEIIDLEDRKAEYLTPDLQYSCLNWMSHLMQCPPNQHLIQQVHDFAMKSILHWIEALSLISGLRAGLLSVQNAQKWLKSAQNISALPKDLIDLFYDVERFILEFYDIIAKAALHVYCSALPFTPSESTLSHLFSSKIKGSVKVLNGRAKTWDSCLRILNHQSGLRSVAFSPDCKLVVSGSWDHSVWIWTTETGEAVNTLIGHTADVTSVAFSPDGKYIVSGSVDKTVRIWSTETGETVKTFKGHQHGVYTVKFSPDGKLVASASWDKTVRLWNTETGETMNTLVGHSDGIRAAAFSPDGLLVVSGSWDRTLKIWDVKTGKSLKTLIGHTKGVRSVSFSPNCKLIVSGSEDKTICIWDVKTGQAVKTLVGHTTDVHSAKFSPDGKFIASGAWDKTIRIWNTETGEAVNILRGHSADIRSVAFSHDGKLLVSGSGDRTVRIWSTEMGEGDQSHTGHSDGVRSVAFSPDGKLIVSGSWDKTVRVWKTKTGEAVKSITGESNTMPSVAFSPDNTLIAAEDRTVRMWNRETGEAVDTVTGRSTSTHSVAFSPGGKLTVSRTNSSDRTVRIWETEMGEAVETPTGIAANVRSVSFSQDGKFIISGSGDRTVRIWSTEAGEAVHNLNGHSDGVRSVAFSPDNKLAVSGSYDKTIRIWETESGEAVHTMTGHSDSIRSVAFSPSGKLIVSGSWDKTVRTWNAETGEVVHILKGHTDGVRSVAFSPDGATIASGSWDRTVRLWNTETGVVTHILTGHTAGVYSVAFSPDGKLIASGSWDHTVQIWDSERGKAVNTFMGHTANVNSVAFSSDNKLVVSGSQDKTIRIWNVETGESVNMLTGHSEGVYSVAFSRDSKRIISCSYDETIRVWNTQTATLVRTDSGDSTVHKHNSSGNDGFFQSLPHVPNVQPTLLYAVEKEWVYLVKGKTRHRLCWLPEPCRGWAVSQFKHYLVIGAVSGRVVILDLSALHH